METKLKALHELLLQQHLRIATAESCTGGLISASLTSLPGSSDYMMGGVVSYTDEIKKRILQVPKEVLDKYGAVSKETAEAMLVGILNLFQPDYGLSITGFAGPSGGTETNPVGTVYIAVGTSLSRQVKRCRFNGDRAEIRYSATVEALQLLYNEIQIAKGGNNYG